MRVMRAIPGLTALDRPLHQFLDKNAHAFTRAELLAAWTRTALERALAQGRAVRILPGVYCATAHAQRAAVMGEALNLWHPAGLVTGALALHLYSEAVPAPTLAHVRVTNGFRPRAPAWVQCMQGPPIRTSGMPRGISCTTPPLALLDAWRVTPARGRRALLWEALWARVCSAQALAREVELAPRVVDRNDLERVLAWCTEGATSPLEVRAKWETFAGRRFRDFEWQVPLRLGSRRVTVDMLHRRAMVVVELDGEAYHSSREARDHDRIRDTDLAAAGYVTVRMSWRDIVDHPRWCQQRLLAVVASRLHGAGGT